MKPTLFILAAGMGSRYGGLKQLDGLGPSGETIMDYSVYDALRAGFGKIVFVIAPHFEEDFREKIVSKYAGKVPVEIVLQSVDRLPEGFTVPAERVKPWGTGHAVLMGKGVIKEPFAVINADDFYGQDSFVQLAKCLAEVSGKKGEWCMVGFRLGNTLSESGTVSRGVCESCSEGYLTSVTERTSIARRIDKVVFVDENGEDQQLVEGSPVSMNMWGFTPDYFDHSEKLFREFLEANFDNPKSEFYIPTVVNEAIRNGRGRVKLLDTDSQWFGVTYADDRPAVIEKIAGLVKDGVYPERLW